MKLSLDKLSLGLILAVLPLVNGCETDANGAVNTATSPTPVAAVSQPQVYAAPDSNAMPAPPPTDVRMAAIAADVATLPGNIDPASPVASVVKLIQAGVSEKVILSFIASSATPFNLDSDQIIYLRDLGASDAVTTAMISRDQALGQTAPAQSAYVAAPLVVEEPTTTYVQAAPVEYTYFYDSLSPYGSWVYVEGYGRCWQPTVVVVNRDWQPYCDNGRWIYTDVGWYWQSDYSWGWAPFHYGRWFRDSRRGWCWAPDSVWGPSWVSWRYSSDYCGWAPLPPAARFTTGIGFTFHGSGVDVSFGFGLTSDCYTFVPASRFCDSRPWEHRVPRGRETTIYNNTTVINNVIVGNNNTIINRGIGNDRIEAATHTRLQPVEVRHERDANPRGGRHERFDQGGRTLVVEQPPLNQRPPRFGRMPTQGTGNTANAPQQGNANNGSQRGQRDSRNTQNNNANNPAPVVNQSPRGGRSSQPAPVVQNPPASGRSPNPVGNVNNTTQQNPRDIRPQPRSDVNNNANNSSPANTQPSRGGRASQPAPVVQNPAASTRGASPAPVNNQPPRAGRTSPTPAGQNPVVNDTGSRNNAAGNRMPPAATVRPTTPTAIENRRNPIATQERQQQPAFTPAPVRNNAPANNPTINQQDSRRPSSPRVDTQNDAVRVAPAEPTSPRNNNNNAVSQPRVFTSPPETPRNSPSGNSQVASPTGRAPSTQDSSRQSSGSGSNGQDRSNSDRNNSDRNSRGNP